MYLLNKIASIKIRMLAIFLILFSGLVMSEIKYSQVIGRNITGEVNLKSNGEVENVIINNLNDKIVIEFLEPTIKKLVLEDVEIQSRATPEKLEFNLAVVGNVQKSGSINGWQVDEVEFHAQNQRFQNADELEIQKPYPVKYPISAARYGYTGDAKVAIELDSSGVVKNIEIITLRFGGMISDSESSKESKIIQEFKSSILESVKKWRYKVESNKFVKYCANGCQGYVSLEFILARQWSGLKTIDFEKPAWLKNSEIDELKEFNSILVEGSIIRK